MASRRCDRSVLVSVAGLFALLVSAVSPADDSVQLDYSRHLRYGRLIVTASRLVQMSHVLKPNEAAPALNTACNHLRPVRHAVDLPTHNFHIRLGSPGFERRHASRAPPPRSLSNA